MMPNFRNVYKQEYGFSGGYIAFIGAARDRSHGDEGDRTNWR